MKILIVGGGMYVTGRGSESDGTVIPAIIEGIIHGLVRDIAIVTTSFDSARESATIAEGSFSKSGINKKINFFPKSDTSNDAYIDAIEEFEPDLAIICVPDHLHYQVTKTLLSKSIHCLVVKPFVLNMDHGKELVALAKSKNLINRVEFHKRLDESNIYLRENFKSGKFGKPLYFTVEYSQRKLIPQEVFKSWASSSNIVNYLGVHYIDLIYYITEYLPVSVSVWQQSKFLKANNFSTPDSVQMVIEWENREKDGFTSIMAVNWVDPNTSAAMSDQRVLFVGTRARCLADQKHRGLEFTDDSGVGTRQINPYFTQSFSVDGLVRYSGYGVRNITSFISEVHEYKNKKISNSEDSNGMNASFLDALVSTAVLDSVAIALNSPGEKIMIKI
jgi:D-galacturonate reductase